ncbi:MAG: signal recognition particle-docking protein FtsY [Erysipelotrichaceae bacterium]|jgi:fused signal recognition particle receptor|nr:signal recognition particle-docking protein FtsY [Erysipelotrichaceae bacterium]MBQ1740346.1 signal recognition particle-docking protein FtsY [Erysipelotrichaceae bacterium]MBQ1911620.1 signal recognition particle-docking protein FtsY [Erysipelotrichaceae bacterium]MBQ2080051.1 signal recognition particle-docking protein FtsY [Erysipelotrichaceae bacterium]MBQ2585183.1 signal recognition particle-docking protein FtsY [Erysipelotrichaceae bacterium]
MGLFSKDKNKYLHGFAKTNDSLGRKLKFVTENKKQNKEDFMEQLMVTLIEADIGYRTSEKICDRFFEICSNYYYLFAKDIMNFLGQTFKEIYYEKPDEEIVINEDGPTVILMVGVNGSGKTSTCAKLAARYQAEGKTVAMVAADTFRAGATEQLKQWADRLNVPCITGKDNQDPSSVLVEGCRYAKANNIDYLICDTAGRLQNKVNLMAELEKMHRVIGKEIKGAPHNTWLVLDANTGQNGLSQAELFNEITDLNGIILTKMDGTSKGGIIIAIKNITGVPVRFITVGEGIDDLQDFDFDMYLDSIIGELRHAK